MSENQFTNEAHTLYNQYMSELGEELSTSGFPVDEISQSLQEISNQILDLCRFKENGVVKTDVLRKVLKKIGSPREITSTLSSESNFIDGVRTGKIDITPRYEGGIKPKFTAKQIVNIYERNSEILKVLFFINIISIMVAFTEPWDMVLAIPLMITYPLFLLSFFIMIEILNKINLTGKLETNSYLREHFSPKPLHFYPFGLMLLVLIVFNIFTRIELMFFVLAFNVWFFALLYYYVKFYHGNTHLYLRN